MKGCSNCAHGAWLYGEDDITEICVECNYGPGHPSNWEEKRKTNADRIRAMTDEELADFLYEGADDRYCKNYPKCGELLCTEDGIPEEECKRCLLSWLLQSAEGE